MDFDTQGNYTPPEEEEEDSKFSPGNMGREITEERTIRYLDNNWDRTDYAVAGALSSVPSGLIVSSMVDGLYPEYSGTARDLLESMGVALSGTTGFNQEYIQEGAYLATEVVHNVL